jgi:putative membrane protein
LRHHLRKTKPEDDLIHYLSPEELKAVTTYTNVPDAILHVLAKNLRNCLDEQLIPVQLVQNMDDRLTSLATVLAACERIDNTPIPFAYTLLLHRTAYLYCFLLPIGLVDTVGMMTPLVVAILSYTFFGLDALGDEIETPFGESQNDLPLSAMCRTIEINLRESLQETNIPAPLEPVNYQLH